MCFCLVNLKTFTRSKKTWKTFRGAQNNMGLYDEICDVESVDDTINWMKRHPDYAEERIKTKIQLSHEITTD